MYPPWSRGTFFRLFKFLQVKEGWPKAELFGPPFRISILKVLRTQIIRHSLGFNSFFRITFLRFLKFPQFKEAVPNFLAGTNSAERLNFFVPPFCISILKVLRTQILRHWLDFNAFCMVQEHFSRYFQVS